MGRFDGLQTAIRRLDEGDIEMKERVILAIDPGTNFSAYLVGTMSDEGRTILAKEKISNEDLLLLARAGYYDEMVIEGIASYGMGVGKEVFDTCYLIGRLWEIAYSREAKVRLMYRMDVKMHLCHTTRAKDANIRQALIDLYGGIQATKKGGLLHGFSKDKWSALAIWTTYCDEIEGKK